MRGSARQWTPQAFWGFAAALTPFVLKLRFLLNCSLALLAVALSCMAWLQRLDVSQSAYRSPLRVNVPQGSSTTPVAGQVVLVVAEGLTTDALSVMPSLAAIRRLGSTSVLHLDASSRAIDVLTGAPPDLATGAVPVWMDTLPGSVRRGGGVAVLAGPQEWVDSVPVGLSDGFAPSPLVPEPGSEILRHALRRLDFWLPELAVVVLPGAGESAAGTGSEKAELLDSQIGLLWHMMQDRWPGNVVLIAMGTEDGAPVIMAGKGLVAAAGNKLTPGDITLIAAALLGAPLPNVAVGSIPFSLLALDAPTQAEKGLALAQQRQALADAYLVSIGEDPTGESVESDLLVAGSALTARSYDSAFRLASHALNQADAAMAGGREDRMNDERWRRVPVLVLAAFPMVYAALGLMGAVAARSPLIVAMGLAPRRLLRSWGASTVIGAVAGAGAWVGYRWLGQERPLWPLLLWVLVAGAAGALVACGLWQRRYAGLGRREARRAAGGAPVAASVALGGYALSFMYLMLLVPTWLYYLQGLEVTWFLPDPAGLAMMREALGQAFVASVVLIPLPWLGSLIYAVTGWAWRRWGPAV